MGTSILTSSTFNEVLGTYKTGCLSVIPRNVTTPLAIAITNIIGGNVSIAVAVVVLTGIFGGTYGAKILSAMGITDPVSRGLAIGASAQGLGVASIANEKEAFPLLRFPWF